MAAFPPRVALAVFGCLAIGGSQGADLPRVVPVRQAHSHNDYRLERPLLDALERGFCSIEADLFLLGDRLLVGHTPLDLRPDRTLEKRYLGPLRERVKKNGGRVYTDGSDSTHPGHRSSHHL